MGHDIENWSDIRGRIEEVSRPQEGVEDLLVYVSAAEPVPGFPNLLEEARGRVIRIQVPLEGDNRPAPGDGLIGRVSRIGPGQYIVQPGAWSVEPAPHEY